MYKVLGISLLDVTTYQKYYSIIPKVKEKWWLLNRMEDNVISVADQNSPDKYTTSRANESQCVRPVLFIEAEGLQPGEKMTFYDLSWTVLGVAGDITSVICDTVITYREYDKNYSETFAHRKVPGIQKWLNGWLKKRQYAKDPLKIPFYNRMNQYGMKCQQNTFLSLWLKPQSLITPILLLISIYMYKLGAAVLVPGILFYAVLFTCGIVALMTITTSLIAFNRNQLKSGFLHALNAALVISSVMLLFYNRTLFGSVVLLSVDIFVCLNHRYLQAIKSFS